MKENTKVKMENEVKIQSYKKDIARIYTLMGNKDKEQNLGKVLNWLEFKLSEHKIFKAKSEKLELPIHNQVITEVSEPEFLETLELNSKLTEKSARDDLIIFSLKQVIIQNNLDRSNLFKKIEQEVDKNLTKKELIKRINSLVES